MANLWHYLEDEDCVPTEVLDAAVLRGGSIECIDSGCLDRRAEDTLCGEVMVYSQRSNVLCTVWLLLAPPALQVCINSTRLETGIHALHDRDAIRIPGFSTLYFSTEHLAHAEAFPLHEPVFCARCKLEIALGDMAVRCPQCHVWHHQQVAEERCCWSYTDTCALCDQATDLESASFRWTPKEL